MRVFKHTIKEVRKVIKNQGLLSIKESSIGESGESVRFLKS